jgi:hypothetical protein
MKKLVIAGLMSASLAIGAFGQGSINVSDANSTGGLAYTTAGNYYSGTYGLEVLYLNASAVPTSLTGANTDYALLSGLGFTSAHVYANQTITSANAGVFTLGELDIAGVSTAGASVVLALAAWNNSSATWATGTAASGALAGVATFVNPTANYTAVPAPIPADLTGFTTDLVMTTVPEPTTLALAGLGAAALLIFRRRK